MKLSLILLFSLSLLFAQDKTNIAVVELGAEGISQSEAKILTNKLRSELIKTGKFNVVERSQMNEILKEQGFQQTGCTSEECVVEVGQLLGVSNMVAGTIGKVGTIHIISLRNIDIATGKIINTVEDEVKGTIEDVLSVGIVSAARKMAGLKVDADMIETGIETKRQKGITMRFGLGAGLAKSPVYGSSLLHYAETGSGRQVVDSLDLSGLSNTSVMGFCVAYKQRIKALKGASFGVDIRWFNFGTADGGMYKKENSTFINGQDTVTYNFGFEISTDIVYVTPKFYLSLQPFLNWKRDWIQPFVGISINMHSFSYRFDGWQGINLNGGGYREVPWQEEELSSDNLVTIEPVIGVECNPARFVTFGLEAGVNPSHKEHQEIQGAYIAELNFEAQPYITEDLSFFAYAKFYLLQF